MKWLKVLFIGVGAVVVVLGGAVFLLPSPVMALPAILPVLGKGAKKGARHLEPRWLARYRHADGGELPIQ